MGVKRLFEELEPIRIEDVDEFNYADYDLSDSDDGEWGGAEKKVTKEDYLKSRSRRRKEGRAERKLRKFMDALDTDGVPIQKNMSARKWRRVENARLLLTLVDKEDICTDFSDIMPYGTSQFAKLFQEKNNMKAWKKFIKLDEDEQKRILENANRRVKNTDVLKTEGDGWFVVGGKSSINTPRKLKKNVEKEEEDDDGRKHHPAYSAKACFERLNNRFQQLFRQRSLPWAFVDRIERELRCIYLSEPDAVWITSYERGIDRMLVHAVSQYLMLTSKSVTDNISLDRITEVRNPRSFFVPPREHIIPYLEKIRKHPIDFVHESEEEDLNISCVSTNSEPEIISTSSEDGDLLVADISSLTFEEKVQSNKTVKIVDVSDVTPRAISPTQSH